MVAAARAIGRMLVKEKKDWHWLAARLDSPHVGDAMGYNAGPQPKPKQKQKNPDYEAHPDYDESDWYEIPPCDIARTLIKNFGDRLSPREIDFLNNMSTWEGDATPKQDQWLMSIAIRFGWWVPE